MAEEQKDKKEGKQSGIDRFFGGVESWLNNAAEGKSKALKYGTLGLVGGDEKIAKMVKPAVENVVAAPGAILEKAVVTPIKAAYSLEAGVQYVGTRLGAAIGGRRRLAAQEYLKGAGPWSKQGLIYGNADRIVEESPTYEKAYNSVESSRQSRDTAFTERKIELKKQAGIAKAAGNRPAMLAAKAELKDLNRRQKNPNISAAKIAAHRATPGAVPAPDNYDKLNDDLVTANGTLNAERATYLPRVPIFRQRKQNRMERAIRHKKRKTELAQSVMGLSYGSFRGTDYYKKEKQLKKEIQLERRNPRGSRDQALINKNKAELAKQRRAMGFGSRAVANLFGAKAA